MIRKSLIFFCLFSLLLLTTGCWDTRAITDKSLINGISFDLDQDKRIEISALILDIIGKGAGVFDFQNETVNSIKDSVSQAGMNIQSFLPGDITTSKTRIILLGEDFSKTEFIHLLSTFKRRPFSNLNVPVAITNKQPAKKVLELKTVGSKPLSFILRDTIDQSVTTSITQKIELYNIFTYSSEKVDFTLPIIDITPKDRVEVIGSGLLHNGSYTGHFIPSEQSPLLLMMMGKYGNTGNFITKLPKKYKEPYNTISYEIIRPSRKLKVSTTKNKIDVNLKLKVKVRIDESTTIKMLDEHKFWAFIRDDLNKRVKNVIDEIQLANSDVLGIGQHLREHKPEEWKKLNWEKEYPTIKIKPKVIVTILSTGAIGKESQIED
ncbi:Ger(x)C family spore germination protein [Gottfriedia acidiceleris]|uniref:Ger(x)C family spore germination protein n=1 Tax=Gottfriedia acidiceleris TaxID=371036 RepID=UPI00101BD2F0|nr:Ger(x)C family spore germination protein [Gottfriedia acidiceleris]